MVIDLDVEGIGFLGLDQSSREDTIDEDSSTRETIGCYFRIDNVKVVVEISSLRKREAERKKARQGEKSGFHLLDEVVFLQNLLFLYSPCHTSVEITSAFTTVT